MKREKLIEKFIELSILYREKIASGRENYKEINKISFNRGKIGYKIEDCENFLEIYYEILLQHPEYIGMIAVRIRDYQGDLAKKMYQKFYDMDREKNWQAAFILDDRDEEIKRAKKLSNQEQLAKYERRKEENPEEFIEIYNKINDFVDSL